MPASTIVPYHVMVSRELFFVKLVHSVVFWFQVEGLVYLLYAGLARAFNWIIFIPLASILLNGLLLLLNNGRCPITTYAERRGAIRGSVTDMFLPDCIARNTFRVSTVLFSGEVVLLAVRFFTGM